jgi:hypothetical protein
VPKTAVCVLRVEERRPCGVLITVTTTPDVETVPQGEARSVTSYDEAIQLVAFFLQRSKCPKCEGRKALDLALHSLQRG